ncbi:hypothetical protein V5799_006034 [Amblyomma americanum]|uniref:Uncharacterized protein n=1 Tax=Amblyomma americanum TaxID=6943 RepID=A0AAQ4DXJ5_AMBAM
MSIVSSLFLNPHDTRITTKNSQPNMPHDSTSKPSKTKGIKNLARVLSDKDSDLPSPYAKNDDGETVLPSAFRYVTCTIHLSCRHLRQFAWNALIAYVHDGVINWICMLVNIFAYFLCISEKSYA